MKLNTFFKRLTCMFRQQCDDYKNMHESGYRDTEDTTVSTGLNTVNWNDVAEDVADFMKIEGTVEHPGARVEFTTELKIYLKGQHRARVMQNAFRQGQ